MTALINNNVFMDEKIVEMSMQIILHAGDARTYCKQSLDALKADDFDMASEKMKLADKEITEAHRTQTDAIQGAVRGEDFEYNVLFAHAQDTLMTIQSEINMAKEISSVYRMVEERLAKLENR